MNKNVINKKINAISDAIKEIAGNKYGGTDFDNIIINLENLVHRVKNISNAKTKTNSINNTFCFWLYNGIDSEVKDSIKNKVMNITSNVFETDFDDLSLIFDGYEIIFIVIPNAKKDSEARDTIETMTKYAIKNDSDKIYLYVDYGDILKLENVLSNRSYKEQVEAINEEPTGSGASRKKQLARESLKERLLSDIDYSDKAVVVNNKLIARLFALVYDVIAVAGDSRNVLYRYISDSGDRRKGIWIREDNMDYIRSMIDRMLDNLYIDITISSVRMLSIIDEIKTFDSNKFFVKDNNNCLLLQTNHNKYVRFSDVAVDIEGNITEYSPDMFITSKIPFNFIEDNKKYSGISDFIDPKTPEIDRYFETTFADRNIESRLEIRNYIEYKIGQAMFNDSSTQDCVMLIGKGGSGKSLLLNLIQYMFTGDEFNMNVSSVSVANINSPRGSFFLSSLYNSYINIIGEVSEDERLDSEQMKWILGGDTITAEFKNKPMFTFRNKAMFWIASNHIPYIRDNNEASLRRFRIIKFNNTFISKPDYTLYDKMKKEAVVWLKKCIAVYINHKIEGVYPLPDECREEVKKVLNTNDKLLSYFNDSILITGNTNHRITKHNLYQDFVTWCRENNYRPYSREMFIERIRNSEMYQTGRIDIKELKNQSNSYCYIIGIQYLNEVMRLRQDEAVFEQEEANKHLNEILKIK